MFISTVIPWNTLFKKKDQKGVRSLYLFFPSTIHYPLNQPHFPFSCHLLFRVRIIQYCQIRNEKKIGGVVTALTNTRTIWPRKLSATKLSENCNQGLCFNLNSSVLHALFWDQSKLFTLLEINQFVLFIHVKYQISNVY